MPKFQPCDEDFNLRIVKGEDNMEPDKVTPKTGDNYINAEISLPRGGTLARGQVT
jgi:hypothetical protein